MNTEQKVGDALRRELPGDATYREPSFCLNTEGGLQAYMDQWGFRFITARELLARGTPPQEYWPRQVLLCCIFDPMREAHGGPIRIRRAYQSAEANREANGARYSSHVQGLAIDCDPIGGGTDKMLAHLRPLYESGQFEMGLGIGDYGVHIDIFAADSHRVRPFAWPYGARKHGQKRFEDWARPRNPKYDKMAVNK